MAVIPLNIDLNTTWKEITADIFSLFDNATGVEFYLPYEHTKTLELLIDTSGELVIDDTYNTKGIKIDRYFLNTSTRLKRGHRFYARALETIATLSIKDKGIISIHDADVHNIPFNEFFHEHTGLNTTLAVAATKGDTSITVDNATGITVGSTLQIENGVVETTFPEVTDISASPLLVLDRPLDFSFAVGDIVEEVEAEMAVSATLVAPRAFQLIPDGHEEWHVVSLTISMTHSSTGDDSLFGNIAALINGLVFRGYNGTANQYRTKSNWKRNGDFYLDLGSVIYTDKAGGGLHGTKAEVSIKVRSGAVPTINGAKGDYLEVLVQDNLLAIESLRIKAQGHVL